MSQSPGPPLGDTSTSRTLWTPEAVGMHQATQKPLLGLHGAEGPAAWAAFINEPCMTLTERMSQECASLLTWATDEKLVDTFLELVSSGEKNNRGQG